MQRWRDSVFRARWINTQLGPSGSAQWFGSHFLFLPLQNRLALSGTVSGALSLSRFPVLCCSWNIDTCKKRKKEKKKIHTQKTSQSRKIISSYMWSFCSDEKMEMEGKQKRAGTRDGRLGDAHTGMHAYSHTPHSCFLPSVCYISSIIVSIPVQHYNGHTCTLPLWVAAVCRFTIMWQVAFRWFQFCFGFHINRW